MERDQRVQRKYKSLWDRLGIVQVIGEACIGDAAGLN